MSVTKVKDLRNKDKKDLEKMLVEKRKDLWSFRFGVTGSKVRNVKEGLGLKRSIAKILTVLKEKQNIK